MVINTDALLDAVADRCGALQRRNDVARQAWLAKRYPTALMISDCTATEMSSDTEIKLRTGQIRPEQCAATLAMFKKLVAESFTVLGVMGSQFRAAAQFAGQHMLGLRAGDALHLAI